MGEQPQLQNRRRRGVLGGLVVMAVGFTYILYALGVVNAAPYLFVFLGLAFAAAYLTSLTPYVYLVPAATLLALGLGQLIPEWLRLSGALPQIVFLAAVALGFAVPFLVRPQRRWPLVPAALIAIVAVGELFRSEAIVPAVLQPFFVPVLLVAVGVYLIVGPRSG